MSKDLTTTSKGFSRSEIVIRPFTSRFKCGGILTILLFCLPALVNAQERPQADPRYVEAAFLRNFAHYIAWPDGVFADPGTPWRICILGSDPFGEVLESTFEGRTEQGRPFTILRVMKSDRLKQCQIVYVALKISANRRAALSSLQGLPILTVSNAPGFLQEGGIIRFDVSNFVELSVNLDQAKAASLSIQTKMLEVARTVIENGAIRRVR